MKIKIFTTIVLLFFLSHVFSQQQPNSSFENWSITTLFEEPGNYVTTNLQSYFAIGNGNVTKTTQCQHGIYAAHLQTIPGQGGNIFGGIFIGTPGQGGITGGIPFNQKPTALQFYAKYNIQPNDTANVIILLKRNGVVMAATQVKPTGIQNSYTQITAPIIWYDTDTSHFPDTIAAAITSSKFNGPIVGSELYLDNFTFVGATLPFPNGDFENWTAQSFEDPDNWFTLNFIGIIAGDYSATKTTDHYGAGNYALKVKTVIIPNGNASDTMGYVSNGRMNNQGSRGGLPVANYPKIISGYYKYFPVGPDTALAGTYIFGHDNFGQLLVLDSNIVALPPTSVYTYFEVNINYQGQTNVDTLNISFASSNIVDSNNYVGPGSILYVDNLLIEYYPLAVKDAPFTKDFNVYPNPAKNNIYFDLNNTDKNALLEIIDGKGNIVVSKYISEYKVGLDISSLENGLYFYVLKSNNKQSSGKFLIAK